MHIIPAIASPLSQPTSAPVSRPPSWSNRFSRKSLLNHPSRRLSLGHTQQLHHSRSDSRLSEPVDSFDERQEDEYLEYEAADQEDETIRRPVSAMDSLPDRSIFAAQQQQQQRKRQSLLSVSSTHSRRSPAAHAPTASAPATPIEPVHAIATPRPTLLFALASDDVDAVRRVLESGEARPSDDVGPQSALAFTLANDQLKNKMQMVKLLLAYGADTAALRDPEAEAREEREQQQQGGGAARNSGRLSKVLEHLDPATR